MFENFFEELHGPMARRSVFFVRITTDDGGFIDKGPYDSLKKAESAIRGMKYWGKHWYRYDGKIHFRARISEYELGPAKMHDHVEEQRALKRTT